MRLDHGLLSWNSSRIPVPTISCYFAATSWFLFLRAVNRSAPRKITNFLFSRLFSDAIRSNLFVDISHLCAVVGGTGIPEPFSELWVFSGSKTFK